MQETTLKPLLIFIFALFLTGCTNKSEIVKTNQSSANQLEQKVVMSPVKASDQPTAKPASAEKKYIDSIQNTKGLVVLSDCYDRNDFVRIYNEDGSLWYKFTYYYEDSNGKFDYENKNFSAFAFHPDYFLLALKCVGEDKNRYEVIINEENGLKKFVEKTNQALKFETWETHILNTFSIAFDQKENPLREAPNGKLKALRQLNIDRFAATEIKGDWLKVKWDMEDNPNNYLKNTDFGWIKWKENGNLLIELFYFA